MYTTIEADIENGEFKGAELKNLPRNAHVLITLINTATPSKRPVFGCARGEITLSEDFDQPLDDFAEYM